jgi:hypothetical protein
MHPGGMPAPGGWQCFHGSFGGEAAVMTYRMRGAWLCLLLALPLAVPAQDTPSRELIVGVDVRIAKDGVVADYRLDGVLDRRLAEALRKQVLSWRFEPVLKQGQAVEAKTHLLINLQPAPAPDSATGSGWQVTDVSLGQPALARRALLMPDYPLAALRAHLGARVVLVLRLDAKGKVKAVHAEQTSLNRPGDDRLAGQWREIFEDVSVRSAKGWKFRPVETVDGEPVGTTIRIPIVFVYYGDRAHRYYPGPIVPAPWLDAEDAQAASARDQLGNGEIQSLDTRVHLREGVVGRML